LPGELHVGLTPEKLLQPHKSRPWNPLIASTFSRRGQFEAWGRGTLKITELLPAAGLPSTITSIGTESVMVTFPQPGKGEGVNGGASGGASGGVSGGVNELPACEQAHPGQKSAQLARALDVSLRSVERWLRQLNGNVD